MKLERTKNSLRNIAWGGINRLITIILPFILRTLFIYTLGAEYLGLNSLFTSILTVLNLAELGFSNAIVYNMYKPIAEHDNAQVCALMMYYRKIYRIIGFFITICGLIVLPFLGNFINGSVPADINLRLLYLLYLGNTSISYFLFAYKNCILTAHQREDIISKINIILKLFMYVLQAIFLIYFKSYYAYVITMILNTIVTNVISAYYSNKYYPQYKCKGEISKSSREIIKRNIEGLMIGKVCLVSRNAFDNIFLSLFLGLNIVTIYGNYYYIMSAISGMLMIIMTSIGAGIGNSIVTESVDKNYKDYMKFIFMYAWIAGCCVVCLFCLYQPFMILWMGKDLLFPLIDVILICLYFYSLTMGDVRSQYSAATGLFWENRIYVFVETIINLILNYFLGKMFGVHGIIFATWISIFFINFGWGSLIIFKNYFKEYRVIEYYKAHMLYFFNAIIATVITFIFTSSIIGESLVSFIYKLVICILIPNLYFAFIYHRKKEFKESMSFLRNNLLFFIKK